MEILIKNISNIVREQCMHSDNIFGPAIWNDHIIVVVEQSLILADMIGADKEIVHISALLHDYASILDKDLYRQHHIHGAIIAEAILKKYDVSPIKIELIKECILQHRGSVPRIQTSKESICVTSADAMSHIYNVPSLLKLAYSKKGLSTVDGAQWVKDKIDRSWNKLCPEAKQIAFDKYMSALEVLNIKCVSQIPS